MKQSLQTWDRIGGQSDNNINVIITIIISKTPGLSRKIVLQRKEWVGKIQECVCGWWVHWYRERQDSNCLTKLPRIQHQAQSKMSGRHLCSLVITTRHRLYQHLRRHELDSKMNPYARLQASRLVSADCLAKDPVIGYCFRRYAYLFPVKYGRQASPASH